MSEIVVSKFGGTSVADFDAMNRSADIVLSDANVRLVVLSASAGITNLLVALAEGLEPGERFEKLDAIRNIQFAILVFLERLTASIALTVLSIPRLEKPSGRTGTMTMELDLPAPSAVIALVVTRSTRGGQSMMMSS